MQNLNPFIHNYPDFPKKGILFKDLMPILTNPVIFSELIEKMSGSSIIESADALVSIEARGFIFGSAIALKTSKPMILARKPGKLPGELESSNYSLEYGNNSLSIQKSAVKNFQKFAIIDDLLATGGTVQCVEQILKSLKKEITGISVVVELKDLNARQKINSNISSQIIF
tara:strand:+ start:221 stop:733 length:513 start_codon:yes stop_codon:yes gene_type:complete